MSNSLGLGRYSARVAGLFLSLGALAGCEEGTQLGFLQPAGDSQSETTTTTTTTKLVERDVEAPDVFQANEAGLWDGRPSLGGVWVAHPDVKDPERVIIRNNANGKFVIGALFRREREIPGPRVQASSDAAAALGMIAGAPVELNVTALRRETVEETPEPAPVEEAPAVETAALPAAEASSATASDISESALDPIAAAAAAIEAAAPAAEAKKKATTPSAAVAKAAAPAKSPSPLSKPYIQIGIFSVEANANRTAAQMRNSGMVPTIFKEQLSGKTYWRVVVGPAMTKSERSALLKQIRETGFSDAYAVVK